MDTMLQAATATLQTLPRLSSQGQEESLSHQAALGGNKNGKTNNEISGGPCVGCDLGKRDNRERQESRDAEGKR